MNPYWLAPAVAIAVPMILGPLGAWLRVLPPDAGFFLLGTGVFLALIASGGLAAASAYASATGKAWRGSALRAALLPAAVALCSIGYVRCSAAPGINDLSTDLDDRPVFSADLALAPEESEAEAARLAAFASAQREAYPDLVAIELAEPAESAFARVRETAGRMPGWQVVRSDPARLELEITATTRVFGFTDDVAIRVRPVGAGARVDVRSRSRGGRVDFGGNAARIRAFARALRETAA
jgi:uncharacterized protein (DUF1499 family)